VHLGGLPSQILWSRVHSVVPLEDGQYWARGPWVTDNALASRDGGVHAPAGGGDDRRGGRRIGFGAGRPRADGAVLPTKAPAATAAQAAPESAQQANGSAPRHAGAHDATTDKPAHDSW